MGFINKRKISKSILYYVTEISIVIIGIFVAIQLNNYNQKLQDEKEGKKSLKRISTDLQTEKHLMEQTIREFKVSEKYLKDIIYKGKSNDLDSIIYHIAKSFIHYKMNSEYINLKFSGKLNLISNDTLRYNLVNYYEIYYSIYDELSKNHKMFVNEELRHYFKNEFTIDTTYIVNPKIVKMKLKDEKLVSLIKEQIGSYNEINQTIKVSVIDNLLNMIEREKD